MMQQCQRCKQEFKTYPSWNRMHCSNTQREEWIFHFQKIKAGGKIK